MNRYQRAEQLLASRKGDDRATRADVLKQARLDERARLLRELDTIIYGSRNEYEIRQAFEDLRAREYTSTKDSSKEGL